MYRVTRRRKTANWTKFALTDTGKVYSWGPGSYGLLGQGASQDAVYSVPTPISTLSGVVELQVGAFNAYALTAEGQVYAWGEGEYAPPVRVRR